MSTDSEHPTRHEVYYLDVVILRVEDKLFKVPRNILTSNSPVFADMFSIPSGEDEAEGDVDTRPVHLEHVTSTDFERLLVIIYPIKTDRLTRASSWGEAEWMSVLSLADRWQMSSILNLALQNLQDIVPATTKISFGQRYDYPAWILDGFLALCLRDEPLSEEEGQELGLENVIKCAMARERLWEETARASYEEGVRDGKHRRTNALKRSQYGGSRYIAEAIVRNVLGLEATVTSTAPLFALQI